MSDVNDAPAAVDNKEELDFLRSKISSLSLRGEHGECIKLIEENLATLYEKERWPDVFFASLRVYQRCLGLMGKLDSLEERLVPLFKKNNVPVVFAYLLRIPDQAITWNIDYFKNLALVNERNKDFDTALSYCDVIIKLDPTNASACVMRGWILDDLKRHDEAVLMYEQAISLNETNHSARNSLAKHFATANPQLALEYIEKAIELAPAEGTYYDTKAKILMRINEREKAIFCYDLAMTASPYDANYPYQKGELLLQSGKEVAAIAQYRKALALNGEHIPTLWRLAALYENTQPEMALTYINTIASLQPDNADLKLLKAKLLSRVGKEDLAAEQFKEVLDSDPHQHEALGEYANLLLLSNPEAALDYYNRALALAPDIANYHMGKARAFELLEMDAQAVKEYRKAVALDQSNARPYARLAALLASSKPKEAAELYGKAIAIIPDNAFYYAARGELLMSLNNHDEALACFLKASEYDPENGKLHSLLGRLLEEKGDVAGAIEHLNKAIALDKTNPDTFYCLAKLLFDTKPEVSLLHINSAISLDDKNGEYYYFKSQVLNVLGHDKKALEQLRESLRADANHAAALREISMLLSDESPKVALMYIDRAIEIAGNNQEYLCQRASLLAGVGATQKAIEQYGDVLKLNPKNHQAIFGIGKCLLPDAAALGYFDKAIALDGKVPAYHAEKAAYLKEHGDAESALASYGKAIAMAPTNADYLLQKAKLLDEAKRADEACEVYRLVLTVAPENLPALARLGALTAETDPAEAIKLLDHAIFLEPKEYIHHAWKGRALLVQGDRNLAAAEYQTASRLGGETAATYFTLAGLLQDKMPEIALGYSLHSIEEDDSIAAYHLLCGDIYQNLNQISSALDCYKKAVSLDSKLHEPRERMAVIFFERDDANTLKAVDFALEQNPDCPKCLLMLAKILNRRTDGRDVDVIIGYLDKILLTESDSIPVREMLIGLLAEKRAFVRFNVEKLRLNRIRKRVEGEGS